MSLPIPIEQVYRHKGFASEENSDSQYHSNRKSFPSTSAKKLDEYANTSDKFIRSKRSQQVSFNQARRQKASTITEKKSVGRN